MSGPPAESRPDHPPLTADPRQELRPDCSRCQALCCVAPAFARSSDFAIDKPAGAVCPHLDGFACGIHSDLRENGFPGCEVFDCFGAGQHIVQVIFAGRDWRQSPETATSMFAVFGVLRQLKELLWYLAEADGALPTGPLRREVRQAQQQTRRLVQGSVADLERLDATGYRRKAGQLLARVSRVLRADVAGRGPDRIGADLIGAKRSGADLRGVSMRGAYLLGADLRAADLGWTDLLGVDLRGADLRGARLGESLFLTPPQVTAARGDTATTLPSWLTRPAHWAAAAPGLGRRRRPGAKP